MSGNIEYVDYKDESMIKDIMALVSRDLSEPYSIFTYRYFLHTWPELCTCAFAADPDTGNRIMIGTVVSKAEEEDGIMQGYIAMLTVDSRFRGKGIGRELSNINIDRMAKSGCKVIMLETEASNTGALSLYAKLGFIREERMYKYYLNGGDAFRLKLWIDDGEEGANDPAELKENQSSQSS
eukprot:gene27625-33361_t